MKRSLTAIRLFRDLFLPSRSSAKRKFMLLGFFLMAGCHYGFLPRHAFYVSISELQFDEDWGVVKLKVKMFSNDLEDALEKAGFGRLYLDSNQELPSSDRAIFQYLNQKLLLSSDGSILGLSFEKKEYIDDACWIYLHSTQRCGISDLTVKNKIFLELFDSQTNIVRIQAYGEKLIANLDKQIHFKKFSF